VSASNRDAMEAGALAMAKLATAMIARQEGESVDVCRWHRDLMDDALSAVSDPTLGENAYVRLGDLRRVAHGWHYNGVPFTDYGIVVTLLDEFEREHREGRL
jgi:hypothetical protein